MPKQTVRVRNFGTLGLLSDRGSWDIPLQGLEEATNAVYYNGRIGRYSGERIEQGTDDEANFPKVVHLWRQADANTLVGIAYNGVTSFVGNAGNSIIDPGPDPNSSDPNDQVPTLSGKDRDLITIQSGDNLVVFLSDRDPVYLSNVAGDYEDVPNWPTGLRTNSVAQFNGHLFLGGTEGEGGSSVSKVRWSNNYDQYSEFPSTWALDDTTATTGEIPIPSEYGPIVSMMPMKGRLYVYTTRAVFEVLPAGLREVFTLRILFSDDGAMNRRSVVNIEGEQFVVGSRDIYTHNGQNKKAVADKKVRDFFYGNVGNRESVFTGFSPERSEVLVCYGDQPNIATACLRYEYRLGAWTRNIFTRDMLGIENGQVNKEGLTFDTVTGTYAENTFSYSQAGENPTNPSTVGIDDQGNFVFLNGNRDVSSVTTEMVLRHSHLDFEEVVGKGANRVLRLSRVFPQIEGPEGSIVGFAFNSRNQPNGELTQQVPIILPFFVGQDHKIDILMTGRYFELTIFTTDQVIIDSLDFVLEPLMSR